MKKFLLFLTVCVLFLGNSIAQNDVTLNIHHKLATADFALNVGAQNNIGHDFEVTRLEYYISEISIIHDGGTETAIQDLWILVDAAEITAVDLGNYAIDNVESIKFYIGVNEAHNHLDPATYDANHPLAPQFPSMHWGWNGGYRFVAIEGNGGANYDQLFQLHGLGDGNYFQIEMELIATAENNAVIINLDADYTRVLENFAMNSGIVVHGDNNEAKRALENLRDFVFSPSSGSVNTVDFSEVNHFSVFPNPAENGATTLLVEAEGQHEYAISITDVLGRQIAVFDQVQNNAALQINLQQSAGFYFVNLIKEGQVVLTQKLVLK